MPIGSTSGSTTPGRFNRRVRRSNEVIHIELTPMIDVVFLLLTFFLFSIVLMIRAEVLDVRLPQLRSGQASESRAPITISMDAQGSLSINARPVVLTDLPGMIESIRSETGDAPIVLAIDTRSPSGGLIELADTLTGAGFGSFSILGHQQDNNKTPASGSGSADAPSDQPTDQPSDRPTEQP